jgi:hypothetical protein
VATNNAPRTPDNAPIITAAIIAGISLDVPGFYSIPNFNVEALVKVKAVPY